MKVLLLEFASSFGGSPSLLPEGFALLRMMASQFEEAGFQPLSLLHPNLRWLRDFLPGRVESSLPSSLPEVALPIAPPRELVELTGWLERKGVKVLGTDREGARRMGDKWLTYLALRGKINLPSSKLIPPRSGKWLVKPRWGAGGEGIRFGKRRKEGEFFQEFVEGIPASCCLLAGEEPFVLSLNRQVLSLGRNIRYLGSDVPLRLPPSLSRQCKEMARRSAQLLGAKGICGVDLVVGRKPYFIEFNPRPTTSFLALVRILRGNLAEMLVEGRGKGSIRGEACVRILEAPPLPPRGMEGMEEVEGLLTPPVATEKGFKMVVVGWGRDLKEALQRMEETREEVRKRFSAWSS
ncbi:MAG: ATP-grasp domain-containing protein [Candidatus Hadarchaeales archaeon]